MRKRKLGRSGPTLVVLIGMLGIGKLILQARSRTFETGDESLYTDKEEGRRAVRYNREREWLTLVGMVLGVVINAVALTTGFSSWLRDRSVKIAPWKIGPAMPYALASTFLSSLISLPLSYYSDLTVERRYNLSTQTFRGWVSDQAKGTALSLALGLPTVQGVYWIIGRFPRRWWAIFSALTVPLTVILANLAPVLIMPLFNKFSPLKDRALAERIKALAAAQGVTVSDVLQMDMSKRTRKANAMFTGIGNTKRIVLGDTLIEEFTPEEVEIVIAHELGHQVHRDIWKLIGLGGLTTTLTAWVIYRLAGPISDRIGPRFGLDTARGAADVAALPLLSLLLSVVSLVLTPAQNAISRRIERQADRYALDLTQNPEAFIGAMEKLGRMNLADPNPPVLVKHMLYGHPPLQERIAAAKAWAK